MNKVVIGNTIYLTSDGIEARVKKLEYSTVFGSHSLDSLREVFTGGPAWLLQMIEDAAPPIGRDCFGKPDEWRHRTASFDFKPLAATIRTELARRA